MKKVVVGISGGVDSSVAALLLQKQGYEVIGITFLFTEDNDVEDAKKVCKKLNITHHIIDYKDNFKNEVIDKFINDYKSGITPNPCVSCNKNVKLKLLYDKMIEFNCDFIATGHYARITSNGLFISSDLNKDQTYFLSEVSKNILDKLLLPLEGITKEEVRSIAKENNLITANKKDSTDICFIKNESFNAFLSKYIPNTTGDVIDIDTNNKVGEHKGLMHYTIGQRRGLDIGGNEKRLYVVGKDINKNILYVSLGDDTDYLKSNEALIENVNFISKKRPNKCMARFRYRQVNVDVEVEYLDKDIILKYNDVKSVTPGQTCALYLDNECIGGGTIKEVRKNGKKLWYL